MEPQWGSYLFIESGKEDFKAIAQKDDLIHYSKDDKLFRYLRETELSYQPEVGRTEKVTQVKEIPFEKKKNYIIVYSGIKKARFIRNRLNDIDGIRVRPIDIDLENLYEELSSEEMVEPKGIKIKGFNVDKFVVGNLEASVSRKKSFEELFDRNVDTITLNVESLEEEIKFKAYRKGQVRILGKTPSNRNFMESLLNIIKEV